MSWHTVQFTMYGMPKGSTLWSSGVGIVFFSLSLFLTLKIYPVLWLEKKRLKLGSKQIIWHQNQYNFMWFCKMLLPRPLTHFYKYNFKPDLIKRFYIEGRRWEIQPFFCKPNQHFHVYHSGSEEIQYDYWCYIHEENVYRITNKWLILNGSGLLSLFDCLLNSWVCRCSAQSRNRYNSRIVLRKVGILTLLRKVGILTLRKTILELLLRKVGIGTKWEYLLLYKVGIETKLEYRIYCNLFQVVVFDVLPTYAV